VALNSEGIIGVFAISTIFLFFFNDQQIYAQVYRAVSEELEKYKLYLNEDKSKASNRPFISPLSIRKLEISSFLKDMLNRRGELRSRNSSVEINKLRSLIKDEQVLFSGVSAFLLSALLKQIRKLYKLTVDEIVPARLFDVIYVYLDLAFHAFQMDIRVATSFKMTAIVLEVTRNLNRLSLSDQAKLVDKIVFEMRSSVESALFQGSSVECMNLFIASALFSERYPLPPKMVENCINKLRDQHDDEYSARNKKRMTYFEIVTLIYYCKDEQVYRNLKMLLFLDAKQAISDCDPCDYAETAHLLLDLTSCPFLKDSEKNELIGAAMRHQGQNPDPTKIGHFRNFVSAHSWYFNWTPRPPTSIKVRPDPDGEDANPNYDVARHEMLQTHLQKKQLLLAY
jgi:hypothetical protein